LDLFCRFGKSLKEETSIEALENRGGDKGSRRHSEGGSKSYHSKKKKGEVGGKERKTVGTTWGHG